ncbi:MAG: biotin/lipoyl-binding protein [Anaerolineae bacterium]|nr:biotin/lipoyl-binding protein [Anaerolineae bacterium]
MRYLTTIGKTQLTIDINQDGQVTVDGKVINVDMQRMLDTTMYSVIINGVSHDVRMSEGEGVYLAEVNGEIFEVLVEDERTRRLAGLKDSLGAMSGEAIIKAPMPGVVVEVLVSQGQEVQQGDIVVVLESMKMQNEFKAPRAGKVHTVRVASGDRVEQGAVMLTIT